MTINASFYTENFIIDDKAISVQLVTGAIAQFDDISVLDSEYNLCVDKIPEELHLKLIENGILAEVSKEIEVEKVIDLIRAQCATQHGISSIVVIPTLDCNLRCVYCYQKDFRGGRNLSESELQTILDFVIQKKIRYITLYGGEPLQEKTKSVVFSLLHHCSQNQIKVDAVSNGVDLHIFSKFLNPKCLHKIQVTIDGTEIIHNKYRPHMDGSGTFLDIVKNIELALNMGVLVDVRMNVDHSNMEYCKHARHFLFSKFKQYHNLRIYAHPTFNIKNDIHNFLDDPDREADSFIVQPQLMPLEKSILESSAFQFLTGHCGTYLRGGYYIFAPDGIWNCWGTVGDINKRVATYQDINNNREQIEIPVSGYAMNRNLCINCKYIAICAGDCYKKYLESDDFSFCDKDSKNSLFREYLKFILTKKCKEINGEYANAI